MITWLNIYIEHDSGAEIIGSEIFLMISKLLKKDGILMQCV